VEKKIRIRVLFEYIFNYGEPPSATNQTHRNFQPQQLLLIQNMLTLAGKRELEKKLNGSKTLKPVRSGGIMEREEDKEYNERDDQPG